MRGQACAALGGIPCGLSELSHAVLLRCAVLNKLEIPGNHHEQIVEVVGDAARELTDGLHFLTLTQLFLDQAAGFDGVLVLGDVSEQDGKAFTRRECVDLVPPGADIAEYFEVCQAPSRHRLANWVRDAGVCNVRKCLPEVHADQVTFFAKLHLGPVIDITDAPVPIDDEDAVGRTFKYRGNPSRRSSASSFASYSSRSRWASALAME